MNREAKAVGVVVLVGVWKTLRFALYVALRSFSGIAHWALGLVTAFGMLLFVGGGAMHLLVHQVPLAPVWAGLGVALGAGLLLVVYEGLLQAVAPAGTVIVHGV